MRTDKSLEMVHGPDVLSYDELIARNSSLETEREKREKLEEEKAFALRQLEELRKSYAILHELLRRRIFTAKAERVYPTQLELELEQTKSALDEMQKKLEEAAAAAGEHAPPPPPPSSATPQRAKPTGRRKLDELSLPVERIEITDPVRRRSFSRARPRSSAQTSAPCSNIAAHRSSGSSSRS